MSLSDTLITNYQPDYVVNGGADTNSPKATDSMAGNLDQELREIKSVVRQVSLDPAWERWLGVTPPCAPSANAPSYVSATQFTLTNDWTTSSTYYPVIASVGRRVRAFVSTGTITGVIAAATFSGGLTTVTAQWDASGALDAGLTEVQFSAILPSQGAIQPTPNATFLLQGSGAGDYVATSTTATTIDAVNLQKSISIPPGMKLIVNCSGTVYNDPSGRGKIHLALYDGATDLQETICWVGSGGGLGASMSFALQAVIPGDTNAHAIVLKWYISNGAGGEQIHMSNSSNAIPIITAFLVYSN